MKKSFNYFFYTYRNLLFISNNVSHLFRFFFFEFFTAYLFATYLIKVTMSL